MDFLNITQTSDFKHPVFGEGTLLQGRTYYAFSDFARRTESAGIGRIVRDQVKAPVPFRPSHLKEKRKFGKVLLMFSGGFGDAITLGIVIRRAIEEHGIGFDLCCDRRKWESIFNPMSVPCMHVPYPPEADSLSRYDAVLTDPEAFFWSGDGLRSSPVINLARGFGVDPEDLKAEYFIPPAIRERCRLPETRKVRVALHFDSNGLVKCYPPNLQGPLLKTLQAAGFELYILGTTKGAWDPSGMDIRDLRGLTQIPEAAALLEQMDAMVGVDSFVVHLAHLLGIPSVVLLSTTGPAYFQWHEHILCLTSRLECSPCFEFSNTCPAGRPECEAFYHESIVPQVILGQVITCLSKHFKENLRTVPGNRDSGPPISHLSV